MFLTIALPVLTLLAGCGKSSDAALTLGNECIEGMIIPADGGVFSFTYTLAGADAFNVNGGCEAGWISGIDTGIPGMVSFSAEQNLESTERSATIVLNYPGGIAEVPIFQEAFLRPEIVVESGSPIESIAPGGWFTVEYSIENEDVLGEFSATSGEYTWISGLDTETRGKVIVWLDANDTGAERSGVITLTYTYPEGECTVEIPVTQGPKEYDKEFAAVFIHGYYYGELETPGLYDYFFYFTDLGFDQSGYQMPYSTQYGVYVQSETEWTDMDHIGVPEGVYTFAPTYGTADTFTNGWMSYSHYNPDDYSLCEEAVYTGGQLVVEKVGDEYRMQLTVDLDNTTIYGNPAFTARVTFSGDVSLIQR